MTQAGCRSDRVAGPFPNTGTQSGSCWSSIRPFFLRQMFKRVRFSMIANKDAVRLRIFARIIHHSGIDTAVQNLVRNRTALLHNLFRMWSSVTPALPLPGRFPWPSAFDAPCGVQIQHGVSSEGRLDLPGQTTADDRLITALAVFGSNHSGK